MNNKKKNISMINKNYRMKEMYEADNLVVGKFRKITDKYIDGKQVDTTTELKYIFEMIIVDKEIKYQEIFTGYIVDTKENCFNVPFLVDIAEFTSYFPNINGVFIHKANLLWYLDGVNQKERNIVKTKKK